MYRVMFISYYIINPLPRNSEDQLRFLVTIKLGGDFFFILHTLACIGPTILKTMRPLYTSTCPNVHMRHYSRKDCAHTL
jgi:hypothetical protein